MERHGVAPLFFAVPVAMHGDMERAGLDASCRDLCIAAWTYSAANRTDGRITHVECRRLPSYSSNRVERLVAAGLWSPLPRGYELTHYLSINQSRAEIDEHRRKARARQRRFKEAKRAARTSDVPSTSDLSPDGPPTQVANASVHALDNGESPDRHPNPPDIRLSFPPAPDQEPGVRSATRTTRSRLSKGEVGRVEQHGLEVTGKVILGALPAWEDKAWDGVRDAWETRGLREPPSTPQRSLLWPAVEALGDSNVARWVEEGPRSGTSTYDIVGYVLERAAESAHHAALFDGLDPSVRVEWLELEKMSTRLRDARRGFGLPRGSVTEDTLLTILKDERFRLQFSGHIASRDPYPADPDDIAF
jgi:hypothetical protein